MRGSAYALLALGFTLIFGVMRRLNLAFGASIMLGVFIGTFVHMEFEANRPLVALATIAAAVAAGAYVERICFWAVRRDAALASMISTFAIWMQLEELVTLLFPERTYAFPPLVDWQPIEFGEFYLRAEQLMMFVIALATTAMLHVLLFRTRYGLSLRAVADNAKAARVVGLNTGRVIIVAFALASALGGMAAFLIAGTDGQVTPLFGLWATFKGLIAMMLGGMGSIPGAIVGGILLGLIEAHGLWYLGAEYRDLLVYGIFFAVLVVRPGGVLGQSVARRIQSAAGRV